MLSLSPHSDPVVPRPALFPVGKRISLEVLPRSHDWETLRSFLRDQVTMCVAARPEVSAAETRHTNRGPVLGVPRGKVKSRLSLVTAFQPTLLFPLAEEVEQGKGEEAEAAGGASSHGCCLCQSGRRQQGNSPLSQSLPPGTGLVFNLTSFGATLWQNRITTHPQLYCLLGAVGLG